MALPGPASPMALAIQHFRLLDDLIAEAGKGKAIRSRAREAPGLVLDAGLAGFLVYYASKSDIGWARALHEALLSGGGTSRVRETLGDDEYRSLLESLGREGGGYEVLLALATALLDHYNLLENAGDYLRRIAATARKALEESRFAVVASRLLLEYLAYVKRLVEARVKEEGE